MAHKYVMRFRAFTLIDITETKARQLNNSIEYKQQQNWMTFVQTLGLRVNFTYNSSPTIAKQSLTKLQLGSKYKGKQNVWSFDFSVEHVNALSIDMLIHDFDHVPIILNLTETAKIPVPAFNTSDAEICNTCFIILD